MKKIIELLLATAFIWLPLVLSVLVNIIFK